MADYTDLPDTAVGIGGIPSGTTVTALRDNPIAIAERAVGAPKVLGSNYDLLARTVISGTPANIDFTFDATNYDEIIFKIITVVPATDGSVLWLRTSTDGGSTFDAGASAYEWLLESISIQAVPSATDLSDIADAQIVISNSVGSSTNESVSGEVKASGLSRTTYYKPFFSETLSVDALGVSRRSKGVGQRLSSGDIDAVRFLWSTGGNFEDGGVITAYGVRNL